MYLATGQQDEKRTTGHDRAMVHGVGGCITFLHMQLCFLFFTLCLIGTHRLSCHRLRPGAVSITVSGQPLALVLGPMGLVPPEYWGTLGAAQEAIEKAVPKLSGPQAT